MHALRTWIKSFLNQEDSPTFLEYGLLIIVIAMVVVIAAVTVGSTVTQWFQDAAAAN